MQGLTFGVATITNKKVIEPYLVDFNSFSLAFNSAWVCCKLSSTWWSWFSSSVSCKTENKGYSNHSQVFEQFNKIKNRMQKSIYSDLK